MIESKLKVKNVESGQLLRPDSEVKTAVQSFFPIFLEGRGGGGGGGGGGGAVHRLPLYLLDLIRPNQATN